MKIDIIIDYLRNNQNVIESSEKKFLMNYLTETLTQKYSSNKEKESVTKENLLNDLKNINLYLNDSTSTTLVIERVNKIIDILHKLIIADKEEDLLEISYELEKLYIELGLGIRNTDTVQLVLEKRQKNGR